jgi:hypothetical protein
LGREYGLKAFCQVAPGLLLVGTGLEGKDVVVPRPLPRYRVTRWSVLVTQGGDAWGHDELCPGVEQEGELRAQTQDLELDKQYLVNGTENVDVAGILFLQTLLTVTSSIQEIGRVDVDDVFQETKSNLFQKMMSVI